MKMKTVATIEARMTSSRLPGKVLMEYCGKTNLEHIVTRLKRSRLLDEVVVATTVNKTDDPIVALCEKIGCRYYRGSEEDVLLRVLEAAQSVEGELIVEITGDCPMIDYRHVDYLIEMYRAHEVDYVANVLERTFPRGFDTQVFSVDTLLDVSKKTQNKADREHVSLYIYAGETPYRLMNWKAPENLNHPELEVTLDTKEDYELLKKVYERIYPLNPDFSAEDVVSLLLEDSELNHLAQEKHRKNGFKERAKWEKENAEI